MMTIVYALIYCVDSSVRFVLNANTHMSGNQKISKEAGSQLFTVSFEYIFQFIGEFSA